MGTRLTPVLLSARILRIHILFEMLAPGTHPAIRIQAQNFCVGGLSLESNDRVNLRQGCTSLIELTKDWISRASTVEWQPEVGEQGEEGFSRLILTAVAVKQHESLSSILFLDHSGHGFSAVSLLRAMCEELIWVRYLATVSPSERAAILVSLTNVGIFDALKAQDGNGIPNVGFDALWREQAQEAATTGEDRLRTIFNGQGFQLRGKAVTPSVAQLAKRGGMESTYRFLYHATSRAVHFSPAELVRRVWGRPGLMKISSETFERYWAAFALYWGGWLYGLTFMECLLILGEPDIEDATVDAIGKAEELIKSQGAMPILTTQEVFWPSEWRGSVSSANGGVVH